MGVRGRVGGKSKERKEKVSLERVGRSGDPVGKALALGWAGSWVSLGKSFYFSEQGLLSSLCFFFGLLFFFVWAMR